MPSKNPPSSPIKKLEFPLCSPRPLTIPPFHPSREFQLRGSKKKKLSETVDPETCVLGSFRVHSSSAPKPTRVSARIKILKSWPLRPNPSSDVARIGKEKNVPSKGFSDSGNLFCAWPTQGTKNKKNTLSHFDHIDSNFLNARIPDLNP